MEVCKREQIMVSRKIYIFTSILIDLKDIFFLLKFYNLTIEI